MGTVYLPCGSKVEVEELSGTVGIAHLVKDIRSESYVDSYMIGLINVLSVLGTHAAGAIPRLKELAKQKEKPLIQVAAQQAIKKIDVPGSVSAAKTTFVTTPVHAHDRSVTPTKKGKEKVTVTLTPIKCDLMVGLKKLSICNFCGKMFVPTDRERIDNEFLGRGKIFCDFCLRNSYSEPDIAKNTLAISFRGLIGYFFFAFSNTSKVHGFYTTDLREMIENHFKAGISNHVFKYDTDTFTWFIDFSRVGEKMMPLKNVIATVKMQLVALGCTEIFHKADVVRLVQFVEYEIVKFSKTRRTTSMPLLVTPLDAGVQTCKPGEPKSIPFDAIANFSLVNFNDYRQKKYV